MHRALSTSLILLSLVATAAAQGVDPEVRQFVSTLPRGPAVPADDSGKWNVTLFTMQGCAACQRLEQCMASEPQFRSFTDRRLVHFNRYEFPNASQDWRLRNLNITSFPTLVVQAPRGAYGAEPDAAVVVYQEAGFDGECRGRIGRIVAAIWRFLRNKPRPEPAPGPTPAPVPLVTPDVAPGPLPPPIVIPPLEPVPGPTPPAPDVAPFNEAIPDYPELVIVSDPQSLREKLKLALATKVADRLAEHLGIQAEVRRLDWDEAKDIYPVPREVLPAVVHTNRGKVMGFAGAGTLASLKDEIDPAVLLERDELKTRVADLESRPPEVVEKVKVVTSVGKLVAAAIGGASPFALVLLGFGAVRQFRKARGKAPILGGRLTEVAEQFHELFAKEQADLDQRHKDIQEAAAKMATLKEQT